jgi:hypothetical protein
MPEKKKAATTKSNSRMDDSPYNKGKFILGRPYQGRKQSHKVKGFAFAKPSTG